MLNSVPPELSSVFSCVFRIRSKLTALKVTHELPVEKAIDSPGSDKLTPKQETASELSAINLTRNVRVLHTEWKADRSRTEEEEESHSEENLSGL